MSDYKVQSVIFPKEKYSIKEAKKWLKENGLKSPKVDEKTNFYRFRQIDPHYIETEGYTNYITKKMGDSGIEMIIAYKGKKPRGMKGGQLGIGVLKGGSAYSHMGSSIGKSPSMISAIPLGTGGIRKLKVVNKTGGALKVRQIKKFLEESYKPNASNVDDYELDKDLSNDITKVHYNKSKNHAVVTHRGSNDLQDWYENAKYAVGSTTGKHFQQAEDTQKKAEEKYGANNISVLAHSKGAIHAEKFGKNAKEIITLNKPVNAQDLLTSVPDKQYDIKTSGDPVSKLRGLQRGKKAIVIKSKTFSNPLTEHSINVLDRLPENQVIGDTSIGGSRPEFAKDGSKIIYCGGALTDAYTTGQKLKCFYKVGELKNKLKEWLSAEGKTKKEITAFLKGKKKQDVINDLLKMTDIRKTIPQDTGRVLKCKYKVGELKKEIRSKLEEEGKTKKEITAFLKGKKKADLLEYATPLVENVKTGKSADVIKKGLEERRKKLEEERKRKEEELKLIEEQKREKKKSEEEQKRMGEEDFNIPEPAKAPTDIEPVVNRIDEKIKRLAEEGEKHGAVSYDSSTIVTDIAFVLLMKRYGGRCLASNIMKTKGIDLGIDINNIKTRTSILHDNTILERFGEKLKECISRGIGLICIPLSLKFGTSHSGHANMLVYRPFKRLVERFEPHGVAYGNSMKDNTSFNDQLRDLWENKLTRFIGEVRFRTPEEVCPNPRGFQSLEGELKGLAKEGGGFCSMWSFFLAEMTFLNPEKSTTAIIEEVFDITAKDPKYLKSVIRGYVLEVDRELNNLFKEMGKGTFHLGKGSWKHVRGDEDAFASWIIQNVFDSQKYSEAPPNYEPLPNAIGAINDKSDEDKLKETYITRLNSLTKDDLGRINGLYGLKGWNVKKEQIIKALVDALMENRWAKYGSTGIKDLDYILDEGLYKKKDYKGRIAPSGYFIKKRDENK